MGAKEMDVVGADWHGVDSLRGILLTLCGHWAEGADA